MQICRSIERASEHKQPRGCGRVAHFLLSTPIGLHECVERISNELSNVWTFHVGAVGGKELAREREGEREWP